MFPIAFSVLPTVALTYANDKHMDGAGAQLQRIYGIYAISRALELPYVHSPLRKIGYQGLAALETNSASDGLESRYNRIFDIPSDIEWPSGRGVVEYRREPDLEAIRRLRVTAGAIQETILLRILYPYPITDANPDLYRHVKAISPFPRAHTGPFRMAIHVRRGELLVVDSDRMLPNSYYVTCALTIAGVLQKLAIPFVCELYTEVAGKSFVVTPGHHGIAGRIRSNRTICPEAGRLEDFAAIPNLARFVNTDPIETLERMATADALILSRSSFSYLAGILSTHGVIVYCPFWHKPPGGWLTADPHGLLPEDRLEARLESWRRERA